MKTHNGHRAYSPHFSEALAYASELHSLQRRKTSPTPYIAHLLSVCALVLEHGGTEQQAIAGLLHDSMEDQGLERMEIESRFGPEVAQIVDDCTDPIRSGTADWETRKKAKLARVSQMPVASMLVYACDKLHNLRQMSEDMRRFGPNMWNNTNGGYERTLRYYSLYIEEFRQYLASYPVLLIELDEAMNLAHSIGRDLVLE
jgi:(p)ppGpp synthase/HD superfamily hydrolase